MSAVMNLDILLSSKKLDHCPFPVPTGWFFVDYSDALKPGELRNVFIFGQEWVLFRGEGGKVGLSDPYCAHLGAHMGHGGKVVGENLRCPFHHWEYNTEGYCQKIPYAKLMPPVCKKGPVVRMLPVVEKYGMIWAWYHPKCEAPSWELPHIPEMEDEGYACTRRGSWSANTCIQEIAENGVDVAHLKFLHNAPGIPPVEATYDGAKMRLDIGKGYIVGDIYGPGLNVMRFTQNGMKATMISYTVPITAEKSQMNMSFRYKDYPEGSPELKEQKRMVDHMIGAAEGEDSAGFESVDFIVWNNKKFRPNPLLCDGDGPIIQFRKWFQQFYPDAPDTKSFLPHGA